MLLPGGASVCMTVSVRQLRRRGHPRILGSFAVVCYECPMGGNARSRVRADVASLAHRGLSVRDYSRAATRALRRAVPFDGMCVLTLDPATLLPTGEVAEDALPDAVRRRLIEIELGERDFNKFATMAQAGPRAASLSAATSGRLERSLRQRELRRPSGFGDELRAVLADDLGTWGAVTLLRERGSRHFTASEVQLVGALTGDLADGLRRALLLGALTDEGREGTADTGLLIIGEDGSVESANGAAERWLDELGADGHEPLRQPPIIQVVAAGARRAALGDSGEDATARARVRTARGRWVNVHGSVLGEGSRARVAVILDAARGSELAPLIADAYGLTERERRVTQLVARGLSTSDIADELHLSPWTVQDHLKAIFEKSGTSSRGELVARLFFEHAAPSLTEGARADEAG